MKTLVRLSWTYVLAHWSVRAGTIKIGAHVGLAELGPQIDAHWSGRGGPTNAKTLVRLSWAQCFRTLVPAGGRHQKLGARWSGRVGLANSGTVARPRRTPINGKTLVRLSWAKCFRKLAPACGRHKTIWRTLIRPCRARKFMHIGPAGTGPTKKQRGKHWSGRGGPKSLANGLRPFAYSETETD